MVENTSPGKVIRVETLPLIVSLTPEINPPGATDACRRQ